MGITLQTGMAGLTLLLASAASAQDAAPTAARASEWHTISRSPDRIYLADIGGLTTQDEVATVILARVSRRNPATDFSHTTESYSFRCATNQVRVGEAVEFGPDGVETDRYNDGADWETIPADTLPDYLKSFVCDGQRSTLPAVGSIKAFIEAGRGG